MVRDPTLALALTRHHPVHALDVERPLWQVADAHAHAHAHMQMRMHTQHAHAHVVPFYPTYCPCSRTVFPHRPGRRASCRASRTAAASSSSSSTTGEG